MTVPDYRKTLVREEAHRDVLTKDLAEANAALVDLRSGLEHLEAAQAFLQRVAQDTQEQLKIHVEDIVQLAIDSCFPGEYRFVIDFEIKRGRTEAVLSFEKARVKVSPMDAAGGGVVDIAAFALRVAAWTLGRTSNTVILDEPFRFVSRDLQPRAAGILRELSERLDIQYLIVTHNAEIVEASHRVFVFKLRDGVTCVEMKE
jgi:ABC-type Mn2+/Zn2+ transport system ATPase subunit